MQEPELIKALQEGRAEAFGQLVHLYKDRIYNTALGFVQQAADAEEITQHVFIKVYEHIGDFKSGAALNTWLYRIAVTQSLDYIKAVRRRQRLSAVTALLGSKREPPHPQEFNHPGIIAENRERAALLFKEIKKLPEQQRTAYLLQKMEDLPVAQIAAIMSTSVAAIESLLSRAKANLKKGLKDYYSS